MALVNNYVIRKILDILPDNFFCKLQYFYHFQKIPDLDEPKTFNEKIQWLKLNYRDDLVAKCADKLLVRDYVAQVGGRDYLIPLIGKWDTVGDIDFTELPTRFVLKTNHSSGWNIICRDKSQLDINDSKKKLIKWLNSDFSRIGREWSYAHIKPCIIGEEFLSEDNGQVPVDYKFFCFHGIPSFIQVDFERFVQHTRTLYDTKWQKIPCEYEYKIYPKEISRPSNLNDMIDLASKLAEPFLFVRVDLYSLKGRIYFGEMTFYPEKGVGRFNPEQFDSLFGSYLTLPNKQCASMI